MRQETTQTCRRGERGAALVTVLLVSMLMLTAGGALVMTTSMSVGNAVDATAEVQAYYAAEAGLQSAISVARGNVAKQTGLTLPTGTKMMNNFRALNLLSTSNLANDTSTEARLSGWLKYTGSHVSLGNGLLFDITVTDPDDPTRAKLTNAALNYNPSRLLFTSTGYGPKGAVKKMRMLVDRNVFDFTPKSTLLMCGAENCANMGGFSIGQSNAKEYSGNDSATPPQPSLPVFGTTCAGNYTQTTNTVQVRPHLGGVAEHTAAPLPRARLRHQRRRQLDRAVQLHQRQQRDELIGQPHPRHAGVLSARQPPTRLPGAAHVGRPSRFPPGDALDTPSRPSLPSAARKR